MSDPDIVIFNQFDPVIVIPGPGIGPPGNIWNNVRNAKTSGYTVQASDAGSTLALGGSNFYTLAFSAASSYSVTFAVMVLNEDTVRAKFITAPGLTSFWLYPGQNATMFVQNSVWYVHRDIRWKLHSNVTFFVDPAGNDSNDGLATGSANALLTIQKAYNLISANIDLSGQAATIQLADGTYTAGLNTIAPPINEGLVILQGNSGTPSNVVISVTNNNALVVSGAGISVLVQNMKIQTTGAGCDCILVGSNAILTWNNTVFGACGGQHVECIDYGQASCVGNYSITGNAVSHVHCFQYGFITIGAQTVTLIGTPAFSGFFAGVAGAQISFLNTVFSGSATGARYLSHFLGQININGNAGGTTYLPGDSGGTADGATFGLYG